MNATERPASQPCPESVVAVFWAFTWLALQGFGGVLAVVQREVVDKHRWLTREEFLGDWAVAQLMPGPNVVNLALMLGGRWFGLRGALAALAGMLVFPLALLLVLVGVYGSLADAAWLQGALRGMGAVCAGLIAATGLKLSGALAKNLLGLGLCWVLLALTFVAVGLLRLPLVWVLLGLGGVAFALAWVKESRAVSEPKA
jgi:chromate transporter